MKPKQEIFNEMRHIRERVKKLIPSGELDKRDLETRLKKSGWLLEKMDSIAKAIDGGYSLRKSEERIRFFWKYDLVLPIDLLEDLDEIWKKKCDAILGKHLKATRKEFNFALAKPYALSRQQELGKVLGEIEDLQTQYTELPEEPGRPLNVRKVQEESQRQIDTLELVTRVERKDLEKRLGPEGRPIEAFDWAYCALELLSEVLKLNLRFHKGDIKAVRVKAEFASGKHKHFQKQIDARALYKKPVDKMRSILEKALDVNHKEAPVFFLKVVKKDFESAYDELKVAYKEIISTSTHDVS